MPEGGKTRPPATADQIAAALIQINQFLTDSSRSLVFQVDTDSGRTVITVLNPATSEVIRTIPPTELIAMAEMLGKGQLRLVSDRA